MSSEPYDVSEAYDDCGDEERDEADEEATIVSCVEAKLRGVERL